MEAGGGWRRGGGGVERNIWFDEVQNRVDKVIWPPLRVSSADVASVCLSSERRANAWNINCSNLFTVAAKLP